MRRAGSCPCAFHRVQCSRGAPSKAAIAFVRPEAIALAQDPGVLGGLPNCFEGRVSAVLFDGANSSLLIETPGFDELSAPCCRRPDLAGIEVGAPVHFGWTSDAMKVFAA